MARVPPFIAHARHQFGALALACLVTACGGDGDAPVAYIELGPTSRLLTSQGDSARLEATAFDEDGNALPGARITWRSDAPGVVAVSADGVVTAQTAVGSAQVWAEAEGVESPRTLVWTSTLADGAVTFTDDQVVSAPAAVDPGAPLEVGSELTLVVRDLEPPAIGTAVVAAGDTPAAGRVVSATATADGVVLTLEVVPLTDLFVNIDIDVSDTAEPDRRSRRAKFELAGFECEADIMGPQWPEPSLAATLDDDVAITHDVRISFLDAVAEHIMLRARGSIRLDVAGSVDFPIALSGTLGCERGAGTIHIPFGPPVLMLDAKIPLGIGFAAEGSFSATGVVYHATGHARADLDVGFDYTPETGAVPFKQLSTTENVDVWWDTPALEQGGTIKASLFAYLFAKLQVGVSFTDLVDFDIATLKVGVKGDYELAVPFDQAVDPVAASSYVARLRGELHPGEGWQAFFRRFDIEVEPVVFEPPEEVVLFRSPTGATNTSAADFTAGEPVMVTTTLEPDSVDYDGSYNVDSLHIWRRDAMDDWHEVDTVPADPDQTDFSWQWMPTDADELVGPVDFAVYVETVRAQDLLLEAEPDSRQTLGVAGQQTEGTWSSESCTGFWPCSSLSFNAARVIASHDGNGTIQADVRLCSGSLSNGFCDSYTTESILTGSFSNGSFTATPNDWSPPLVGTFHDGLLDIAIQGTVMCKTEPADLNLQCLNMTQE